TGEAQNGLMAIGHVPRVKHGSRRPLGRAVTPRCHAQRFPRPPTAAGDETATPAPHPSRTKRDAPPGDEPAALNGRERGNATASGPAGDHDAPAQPPHPPGCVPPESEYVLGAAAAPEGVRRADTTA